MSLLGDGSLLYHQTLDSYHSALAPGTTTNRARQARAYVTFAVLYNFDYLNPSVTNATMFTQYLANSFTSPLSIKNYISGAKSWITFHQGQAQAFTAAPVLEMLRRFTTDSAHVPLPALPITETELNIISSFIDVNPALPRAIKPCVLISFSCMFRASNVLSPSMSVWGGAHTLKAADIVINDSGLLITIKSTKTTGRNNVRHIQLRPFDMVGICPVRAWIDYVISTSPPFWGPAFILDNGRPLTAGPVVSAIRNALDQAGYPNVNRYSMHSFRRGSVQVAQRLGVSRDDIMAHGLWRSDAGVNHYLQTVSTSVSQAFARQLAM